MFDLGSWGEFFIIAVLALIIIGPKDMPGALRTAGRMIAKLRSFIANFQSEIEKTIQKIEQEDLKKALDELHAPIDLNRARKNKDQDENG